MTENFQSNKKFQKFYKISKKKIIVIWLMLNKKRSALNVWKNCMIQSRKNLKIKQKKTQHHDWLIMMIIMSLTFEFVLTNFFFDVTDFLNAKPKAETKAIFIDSIFVLTSRSASNSVKFYINSDRWISWFQTELSIVYSRKSWIILI